MNYNSSTGTNGSWYKFTIHTATEAVDAIAYMLEEMGFKGIEIQDPMDIDFLMQNKTPASWDLIDEDFVEKVQSEDVQVSCYVSFAAVTTEAQLEHMQLQIAEGLHGIAEFLPIGTGNIEVSIKNEADWANAWKKYYKPFRLGRHIHIVPTWIEEEEDEEGDIRITMDPGMAFGTGTHETTSMCIPLLEDLITGNERVFDIGTGSGILGICASKVGAKTVVCSDLDANAVKVAKENVAMNQVGHNTEVYLGDLLEVPAYKEEKADIVVANIIADVIIGLTPGVRNVLKEDGHFICSGIITERRADVEKALIDNGYTIEKVTVKGSWVAIQSHY